MSCLKFNFSSYSATYLTLPQTSNFIETPLKPCILLYTVSWEFVLSLKCTIFAVIAIDHFLWLGKWGCPVCTSWSAKIVWMYIKSLIHSWHGVEQINCASVFHCLYSYSLCSSSPRDWGGGERRGGEESLPTNPNFLPLCLLSVKCTLLNINVMFDQSESYYTARTAL